MTAVGFLKTPLPRLLFVGGKGGVGKTSLAAATSLSLAQLYPQQRILVASTDPAHSLADCFGCALGPEPCAVYEQPNLFGLEIDVRAALQAFLAKHGTELKHILSRGTYLADEDVSRLLDLQFPGLDEMMALLQMTDFLSAHANSTIVVDTAPTGHTLRLLELPTIIDSWVTFLYTLLDKHRYLARLYTGRYDADPADAFLDTLARDIAHIRRQLQDQQHTQFVVVTIAETVVLAETVRLIERLSEIKVSVKHLLVNRVLPPSSACTLWTMKRQAQQAHLQRLGEIFPNLWWTTIPLLLQEVRGQPMLTRLAGLLVDSPNQVHAAGTEAEERVRASVPLDTSSQLSIRPTAIAPPVPRVKLLLFGGKGGVGKTSLACAMAIQLARRSPAKRVLLFSTDPAHSLADCLGQAIGEQPTALHGQGNLFAYEINPTCLFEAFRQTYAEEMAALFVAATEQGQFDAPFDRQAMTHLMNLIPPGIDEIMSLIEIMTIVHQKAYDYYVLDNAPTGHLLRFLELPELMQDWLRIFFLFILKYSRVAQLPKTSAMLVQMSKDLKAMSNLFTSPAQCEFVPVAIPTVMSLQETRRLLTRLAQLHIHCQRLLINQVWRCVDGCEGCSGLHTEEEAVITRYHQAFPALDVVKLPWLPGELKEVENLAKVFRLTAASVRR